MKGTGILAEIGASRIVAVGALVVVAIALQSTLLARATILRVIPQLVFVVIVCLAYVDGERVGVVTGFVGGLLQDLLLPGSIVGLTALVYVLLGYGVGAVRRLVPGESVWMPVFVVAGASAIAEASYALLAIMLGQPWISLSQTAKVMGLVVLYNTLLTPFVFPLVRRIAERFRPERVYRW
ncbi:MAG TPA: rod shape-determining protein MreD [Actinomycetota bacterium]|nr:rod shape-determining protein MreD [Actinomycetota bacterium]